MLTYGLSSEYLKSTKEAEAKKKAPDADRSLYRCGVCYFNPSMENQLPVAIASGEFSL